MSDNNNLLAEKIKNSSIGDSYDLCIIDTPPTSGIILLNAIAVSDYALIPMQTEYLGLVGVMQFLKLFYKTAPKINSDFKLLGITPTLYSKSIKQHKEILNKLEKYVGRDRVFNPVRRDFKLSSAFMEGKPIVYIDQRSRGSKDYKQLAEDILEKL